MYTYRKERRTRDVDGEDQDNCSTCNSPLTPPNFSIFQEQSRSALLQFRNCAETSFSQACGRGSHVENDLYYSWSEEIF